MEFLSLSMTNFHTDHHIPNSDDIFWWRMYFQCIISDMKESTKILINTIIALYDEGETGLQIAKKMDKSLSHVCKILKANGRHRRFLHEDKIGKIFGWLEIIELKRNPDKHGMSSAFCNCLSCGKIRVEIRLDHILRGHSVSCGCRKDGYEKIVGEKNVRFDGFKEMGARFVSVIKYRAKCRNINFNLTKQYLWELYEKQKRQCAISGVPIFFERHSRESTCSLDRVDSFRGYEEGNVQWVHKDVNIMKNVFPLEYFVGFCQLIGRLHPEQPLQEFLQKRTKWGSWYKYNHRVSASRKMIKNKDDAR